jgi:tripartite ATP-independent transporter DctM subunit
VLLIVYGLVDNSSIGKLYAGAIFPGLLLASLFIGFITIRCYINPRLGPPVPDEERMPLKERVMLLLSLVPPGIIIFLVLGTIFTGIAAPTEAAGVGAIGAMILTGVQGQLSWKGIVDASEKTLKSSAMVLWTMFGANIFVGLYVMCGGGHFVTNLLLGSGMGKWGIILTMQGILLFLGCFIDWTGIIMLCVPIFGPIVRQLGFDPVWFGVLFATNMQISFLSPPFGYALFYLKGVAPPEIQTTDIWKGAAPFIGLQVIGVLCVMKFHWLALFLPELFYG